MGDLQAKNAVLTAVAEMLRQEVDLDTLLGRMLDMVAKGLDAERATLFLFDAGSGCLVSRVAHLPELEGIRLEPGQGAAGKAAKNGEVVNVSDPGNDPTWYSGIDARTGFETRCLLAVPIKLPRFQESVVGVLQILNKRTGEFNAEDEAFAGALALQVGTALECTSLASQLIPRKGTTERQELRYRFNGIVGTSSAMQDVYARVERAAATDATVLIQGESGTGKELLARAIHFNGPRREKPLVKVDCAALPATLVENELFGHAKGAYTGADRTRAGRFEIADGGTLFLDEIGELPLQVQGKLLRFLQDREFEPIGSNRTIHVDVRVISATNRDLQAMVSAGEFREDLYYRLRVIQVELPALRERGEEDLRRLVEHFLTVYNRKHGCNVTEPDEAAWKRLAQHPWPGNVRELEHAVEAAVVMAGDGALRGVHFGVFGGMPETGTEFVAETDLRTLEDVERSYILRVLKATDNNRSKAAHVLKIGRNTLTRKLAAWGIRGGSK